MPAVALVLFLALGIAAQDDPDPNSPTPILLSETASTRALATKPGKVDLSRITSQSFAPNSTAVIIAANIVLGQSEGADAFRVYAIDRDGHEYRFPVLAIEPLSRVRRTLAVTIRLKDELGYWNGPAGDGDVLIYLTWRGLASNQVRLGIGRMGGILAEAPGSRPTPLGTTEKDVALAKENEPGGEAPEYVGYKWSGDRMRFLEQATFGPNSVTDTRVRRIGIRSWLAEQFAMPYPSTNNQYPATILQPANAIATCDGQGTDDVPPTCFRDSYTMYQPQTWFFREAYYGDAQLRHRVAWALAQILVTSGVDVQQGRHMVEYHKVLSANAFGNYRTLLKQMTLNPTMGDYLSMALSTKNSPNENYAREIMQLFSVGLFMLNQNGTVQCQEHNPCQAGDTPIPTYDQNTVNNMTKVMTGWTFCQAAASCPNLVLGSVNYIDPMLLNTNNHDLTAKTLLVYPGSTTTNVPVCTAPCTTVTDRTNYANASLDQAIDNIFNHPNVGPFVSKILIQHLVTSDPTPQYVSDVAAVFNNNGFGVRGDLKAVVKAILVHPEARGDAKTDPHFGKLREPVMFATNLLRTFNVRSADGLSQSDGFLAGRGDFNAMAQVPFFSPTVFNFYPPDYVIPGTSMPGPEFAILTTGTAIQRTNFVNRFAFTVAAVPGGTTDAPFGTSLDFSDLQALAATDTTGNLLMDELNRRMLHNTLSTQMRNTILTAVTAIPATTSANFLLRAQTAVYLVATSSQYQVQR
jgi:uncharacterized protein (DUF1800 family)